MAFTQMQVTQDAALREMHVVVVAKVNTVGKHQFIHGGQEHQYLLDERRGAITVTAAQDTHDGRSSVDAG
jgi:hypothetical protein